jgi:hypothetical protein
MAFYSPTSDICCEWKKKDPKPFLSKTITNDELTIGDVLCFIKGTRCNEHNDELWSCDFIKVVKINSTTFIGVRSTNDGRTYIYPSPANIDKETTYEKFLSFLQKN